MKKIIIATGLAVMMGAPQLLALSVTLQQGAYSYGVGGEFVAAGAEIVTTPFDPEVAVTCSRALPVPDVGKTWTLD